jgi:hypothetical protein
MKTMRMICSLSSLILFPAILLAQYQGKTVDHPFPKHFLSVNPLNGLLFQQAGLSYEFKPDRFGYELTGGYVYPNYKDYSNYFIAGITNYASFGDYHGLFVVPQFNFYFNKPKRSANANLFYVSMKVVYKYLQLDSTNWTQWHHEGDDYYYYRKMVDHTNIYGGNLGFGYKLYFYHVFFDLYLGLGFLNVNHQMTISKEGYSVGIPLPGQYNVYDPPKNDTFDNRSVTISFSVNIGGAF